ncbi:MAG: NAD(P)-binding domain-containing protein, partial [Acidobacteria bacterium]|nr:NAD(P)-binding domain-containing protein [Acidobacteriota bacterium]
MQLGIIGLGRMGANMAERLMRGGHRVVAYDRDPAATKRVGEKG